MNLENIDYIHLDLNYEDLKKLNIDYILSTSELESSHEMEWNEIYSEYGMHIYKISENIY